MMSVRSLPSANDLPMWARSLVCLVAAYAIVGGIVTLIGWFTEIQRLTDWKNDGISMFPNTAACVIMSGVALLLHTLNGSRSQAIVRALGGVVASVGGLTLLEHLVGISFGIDTLLSSRTWGQTAAVAPMRMGPPASLSFLLMGVSTVLLTSNVPARRMGVALGMTVSVIALLSFTGHLYGAQPMYTIPRLTGIAMQTASMLLALGIGLVASVPEHNPMRTVVSPGAAGMLARRTLPMILVAALGIGWVRVLIQDLGLVDTAFGTALRTVIEIVLLITLLLWALAKVYAYEAALRASEAEVRQQVARERRLHDEASLANAQFRAFFDQGPLFAGIMHVDGTIVDVNRLALDASGFTKEQVVGKLFWECPWWTPAPELIETIRTGSAMAAAGEIFRTEMPYYVLDGSARMVDVIILPVKDEQGRILFLATTGTDITERSRLEREMRQLATDLSEADRRKDEFLAMLAHELRNPLAPIRNALEALRHGRGDSVAMAPLVPIMDRQVTHMVRLIDDLLDVSRVSRGKVELRTEIVDLTAVIEQSVEVVRPLCDAAQQDLRLALSSERMFVNGDPVRLAQVLGNLLNNASKYTPAGGRISVHLEREGDRALIRVRDSGIGIAPGQLPHVFDMFMQGDTSLERAQTGLGIGLTLVRKLVEMHEGTVAAESEGPGRGSELIVRLPVTTERPIAAMARAPKSTPAEHAGNRRVLIVDDNQDAAESLSILLEMAGCTTCVTFDGASALDAAASFRPDVMLLDIGLPTLNGYEVARRVRRQEWGTDIVIIALTGWGQEDDRKKSSEAGFNAHLVKPVDYAELTSLIEKLHPGRSL